jgi:L-ascorbate metabolism protein UlaG (beta-lactamase superfamily)
MDISFLGHSAFKLKGKTASVVTDPYDPSIGLKFPKTEADIVTITHDHLDHNAADQVGGNPFVISGPGEYEVKGVKIIGVPSFHDEKKGEVRGKNTIYNIKIDGLYICHLGDLGQTELGSEQSDAIGQVDVLLIPVGGFYTIDAQAAAKIAASLEPKIVIPMHYLEAGGDSKLEPVDKFLKEIGVEGVSAQAKLSVTPDKLPEELAVVLMEKV